ncbi:hypothetical protein [Sphingomonas abietis]|uniref:Uncharacterized protein n=1 Tax=Sphingomonas abietis TaxID=3012344 RepID=A0ABY7NHR9_9SPHN|nr:hypothetical protein [Sphingomonas abietis]WBO20868.1 hypothetical protein PBT88_11660 [Sphingomonas abietis]
MRILIVGWGALAALSLGAGPALATHHGKTHHAKAPAHHAAAATHGSHHGKASRKATTHKPALAKSAASSGATTVPSGGIKLFCGPGKGPLMVRKMTQGSGTTVTVICR